jgi:hypothetical protein
MGLGVLLSHLIAAGDKVVPITLPLPEDVREATHVGLAHLNNTPWPSEPRWREPVVTKHDRDATGLQGLV